MRMRIDRHRWIRIALAALAVIASLSLLADRRDRHWPAPPSVPYADPNAQHWLYRSLDVVASPGDALAVWGWAAHVWVYSGLLPATRESSTEFAWLDWGPDHYYRRRYLDALAARPPEFIVEAVGPGQFLFSDRSIHGMDSVAGLKPFVDRRYSKLFDDGSIGLYVRQDRATQCCTPVEAAPWRLPGGTAAPSAAAAGLAGLDQVTDGTGFAVSDEAMHLSLPLSSRRPFDAVLVPLVVGQGEHRDGLRIRLVDVRSGRVHAGSCDRVVREAVPLELAACVVALEGARDVVLVLQDMQPGDGNWLATGLPVLLHAPGPAPP